MLKGNGAGKIDRAVGAVADALPVKRKGKASRGSAKAVAKTKAGRKVADAAPEKLTEKRIKRNWRSFMSSS